MTITILAMTSINPGAEGALDMYLSVVGPLMQSVGAKIISRYELSNSIAGSNEFQYATLVEYPDKASIRMVFDSEEYKSLDEVKQLVFSKYQVNEAILM